MGDDYAMNVDNRYFRLVLDSKAKFGSPPPPPYAMWRSPNLTRYIRMNNARRSMIIWKLYGQRLDSWENEHFSDDLDYFDHLSDFYPNASVSNHSQILTDEEKRTFARWIDLGCSIDNDTRGGYRADTWRPILTISRPASGNNASVSRVVLGMHDHESGLDLSTLQIAADFSFGGISAGGNLAGLFANVRPGVWQASISISGVAEGTFKVSVKDVAGNTAKFTRTFSVP